MSFDLVGKAVRLLRLPTVNYSNSSIKIIPAQQGDVNTRFFIVELFDDRGIIELSPYTLTTLNATLPDGTTEIAEGEIDFANNKLVAKISGTMMRQEGKVACEVAISNSTTGLQLTSQTFYLYVSASQFNEEAAEGSDDYNLLLRLMADIEKTEAARGVSETEREKAEAARVEAEDARTNGYNELISEMRETIDNINDAAEYAAQVSESVTEIKGYTERAETAANTAEQLSTEFSGIISEVEDARIGSDGTIHESAGGHIRNLESSLEDRLAEVAEQVKNGVPDDVTAVNDRIYLTVNGEATGNGVELPASGASGLDYEMVTGEDGGEQVRLWLTDKNGEEIENSSVQFSGGSGGGGGSSYVTRLFNASDSASMQLATGQNCIVKYYFKEMYGTEQTTARGDVVYSYSHDGSTYTQIGKDNIAQDAVTEFDLTDYLVSGANYLKVTVTGGEGQVSKTLTYSVTLVDCYMVSSFNPYQTYYNNFSLQYSCVGRSLDKTVYILIDGEVAYTNAYGTGSSNTGLVAAQTISTSGWEHGVHTLELYFVTTTGVESPHLKYDVMYSAEETLPILSATFSNDEVTYGDVASVYYAVYTANNGDTTDEVTRRIYYLSGDGNEVEVASYTDTDVPNNSRQEWNINFSLTGMPQSGIIYIEISVKGGNSKVFGVTVNPFTSEYNIMTVSRRLIGYISPTGQSNSAGNSAALSVPYTDNNETTTTIKAEMENFNYSSNGYVTDGDGNYCLRMSGDARLKIYLPLFETNYIDENRNTIRFDGSVQSAGRTAEFRLKVSKVTDSKTPVISCFTATTETEEELQGAGFRVLPQSAYIMCNGQTLSFDSDGNVKNPQDIAVANFCADEIIRLSFVVEGANGSATGKQAIKIYLNGELTRIVSYDTTATFTAPPYIELGSNGCILDLYSCDFYDTYLSDGEVMQNSFTDLPLFADRVKMFEENAVENDSANGRGFTHTLYPTTYVNNDDMLDYYACRTRMPCILTTGAMSPEKGTKTKVGIVFTKPADNDDGYEIVYNGMEQVDGSYINQTNVQGTTSSQLYPRFNYKLTFYKPNESGAAKKYKYVLKEGSSIGESTLCWKADVMSSDHANTVNAVYFEDFFTEKIPPAQENADVHPMIYGYRCLLFNRANADDTTPINFMGDGCLNNDKSNSATFGLSNDCDTDATDSYWTEGGITVTPVMDGADTVAVVNADGDVETKCQKWEFLDNSQPICSFQTDKLMDGSTAESSAVYNALESSYPDQGDLEDYKLTANYGHIQLLFTWLLKRANFWTETNETAREAKKAIFKSEFAKHVNLEHALSYFIAVRVTALIDNYAKNMFLCCYDTCADKVVFTSAAQSAGVTSLHSMMTYASANGGDIPENFIDWENSEFAVWYPTMYDLDSCYGVDNKGYRWIPYYADWDYYKWNDETQGYVMNGAQSYFWRMFYEAFYPDIKTKFNTLADTTEVTLSDGTTARVLSLANWTDKMITTNIETVPVRITTEDSIFKYVMPWLYGYVKGANYSQYAETPEFLYLVQSNKELQDKDFMTRRMNLLYSEFESNFYTADALTVLLPASNSGSDFTADNVTLTLTPSQTLYCKVRYDTQSEFTGVYAEESEAVEVAAPTGNVYNEATITIAGASLLSYIDGLQKLKGTAYNLGNATKLRALTVGSTAADYINTTTTSLTVSACEMLEEINVAHLTGLQTLDLSNCSLLKTVEASGCSALSSITFPIGGYLETVHLPAMSTLILRQHENIKDFSMTTWDSVTDTYTADYSKLTTLYLEGNMSAIPLGEILLQCGTALKGLRLVDVDLDLSDMSETDAIALIEILADDTLYGKQIDSNGVQVSADAGVESTWYPIITGRLTVGGHEIDDEHDLMLVKIMERYPSLMIAPPETADGYKLFNECKFYEIKAVVNAAEKGTLTNNGTPCGLEYDSATKTGWWEVGDSKALTTNYNGEKIPVTVQIGAFYKDRDPEGNLIPVTLVMKNASAIGTRAMNAAPRYYNGFTIDGSEPISLSSSTGYIFTNEGEERDIEIVFTQSSFISSITRDSGGTTAQWYLTAARTNYDAESNPEGDPYGTNYLSQEDVLGDAYTAQQAEVTLDGVFDWDSGLRSGEVLTLDGTNGGIHIYNQGRSVKTATGYFDNNYRNIEIEAGTRIVVHNVAKGGTIKIVPRSGYNFGGYWRSDLHEWIEGTFFETFPEAFRRILSTSRIKANISGLTTHTTEYRDVKIALMSYNNAGANSTNASYTIETAPGDAYPLFSSNDNRIKYLGDNGTEAVSWWLLSSYYSYTGNFHHIVTSGGFYSSSAANAIGVVARFFI